MVGTSAAQWVSTEEAPPRILQIDTQISPIQGWEPQGAISEAAIATSKIALLLSLTSGHRVSGVPSPLPKR